MSVCWDAEAIGRSPCGALSTQDSSFLLIPRIIMRVPDIAREALLRLDAAVRLLRRGQLEPQAELQRDGGGIDQAGVASARPHVREVERAGFLAFANRAGAGDGAVADDLNPGAHAFARGPRDVRGERYSATRAEQAEGDRLGAVSAERADALHDQRDVWRVWQRCRRRSAERAEHVRLERVVRRRHPRDRIA